MHNLQEIDTQEGKTMAWHGLTKVNPELDTKNCHLNFYEMEPEALFYADGSMAIAAEEIVMVPKSIETSIPAKKGKGKKKTEPEPEQESAPEELEQKIIQIPWSILKCSDGPRIGAPFNPSTYKPLSNRAFLDVIDRSIEGLSGASVESVMTCGARTITAVGIKIADLPEFKIGNRTFEPYLSFIKGQGDKKTSFDVRTGNICPVCQNTVNAALSSGGKLVSCKVKLTKNSQLEIDNIPEIVRAAIDTQAYFAEAFSTFDQIAMKHSEAKALFTGALLSKDFSPEDVLKPGFEIATRLNRKGVKIQDVSTRALNTVDRLLELFHDDGKGNEGRTLADAFNAITDFYSHESSGGTDKWKQFVSSEFGSAHIAKSEFFQLFISPEKLALVRQAGEKLVTLID